MIAVKMKVVIAVIVSIVSARAQGQSVQAVLSDTTSEPMMATSQPNDTASAVPKGNITCNYYSFDVTFRLFNKTEDVEEFLARNTKTACTWRRNNGNQETEARQYSEFRRAEIKNSTIARIPEKFFANFSRLVIFRARFVKLQEIRPSDFESTDFLQLIDLSRNEIKRLEKQQFVALSTIKEIDLSGNLIETIDDEAFDMIGGNLTRIDLGNNKIKSFKEDFILTLIVNVSRKWLPFDINLRNNEIERIEPSQRDAIVLPEVNLELSGNRMKNLELLKIEIFEIKLSNHSLEGINVNASFIMADNNRLTKLRIKGKTRSLSVRNNQISEVTYDDHLSMLRSLIISDNKLSAETVYNVSQKIVNVEQLDLSNNSLGALKIDTFSELTRLERLSISNTGLSEIAFGTFAYQKNLKLLDVSYNNLSDFDLHVFSSIPNLEVLDLSGTNISSTFPYRKVLDILPKLRSIGLEDNNWKCENLSRLKIYLNSRGIMVMDPVNPVKNESSVAGIKCTSNSEAMKNTTTTTTVTTTAQATTNAVNEKLNEMMNKVNELHEKGHEGKSSKGATSLELALSIFLAIASTLLIIYAIVKVKNYYKRNRFHMPFSGRSSPDTVITYEGSIGR